jgi:enamine deaminase RidA (YjgF/YER057c/UK114 family)
MKVWGTRPDPPAITVAIAIGLARPEFLVEIDAIAVVEERVAGEKTAQSF